MLELALPDVARHLAWLESHREWGPGLHEDGFGIRPDDDVETPEGFSTWVAWLRSRPGQLGWIVDGEAVLGGVVLRPFTTEWTSQVGHVGYGVRPSARGRGIATWALTRMLEHARTVGMDRVLVVCRDENMASARTIERCKGVLESRVEDERGMARRYWIDLQASV